MIDTGTLASWCLLICIGLLIYLLVTRTGPGTAMPQGIFGHLFGTPAASPPADDLQSHIAALRAQLDRLEQGGRAVAPAPLEPQVADELEPAEPSARHLPLNERYTAPAMDHMTDHKPTTTVLARVWPMCREWLADARTMRPQPDPLLTAEQTREARVIQSALVEHGTIIETTILEALRGSPDHCAWQEPAFRVSYMASHTQKAGTVEGCALAELPYGDGTEDNRKIQVDLIAYDKRANVIRAYEIKRRSDPGQWSAANLAHVQMLLRSYARTKTINGVPLDPVKAETYLICYYSDSPATNKLTRDQLDKHFGVPIVAHVEEATAKFRGELQALIATP